jgi:Uncharacterized protein conserved in bacteria
MQSFESTFMRTLRQIYDTEKQLSVSLAALCVEELEPALTKLIEQISVQSKEQAKRLEAIFSLLYLSPRSEVAWPATAMLREAWNAVTELEDEPSNEGCAASLLAIKRYELSLYESLYCWSRQCALDEVLPNLRRSIAEELVNSAALSQIAFGAPRLEGSTEMRLH